MRRRALGFALALSVLACSAWWARQESGDDYYVFLHVVESNNQALGYLPSGEHPAAASFSPEHQTLWVAHEPPERAGILALYEMDTLGLRLYSEIMEVGPDYPVPLSEPLSFTDHPQGYQVIDNEERLLRHDLVLKGVDEEGGVVLEWGGEEIVLSSGQGWSVGKLAGNPEPLPAVPDSSWEQQLAVAWEEGTSASRLTVFNYGLWPRPGLSAGEGS